jgi:hypothetical protein
MSPAPTERHQLPYHLDSHSDLYIVSMKQYIVMPQVFVLINSFDYES